MPNDIHYVCFDSLQLLGTTNLVVKKQHKIFLCSLTTISERDKVFDKKRKNVNSK